MVGGRDSVWPTGQSFVSWHCCGPGSGLNVTGGSHDTQIRSLDDVAAAPCCSPGGHIVMLMQLV